MDQNKKLSGILSSIILFAFSFGSIWMYGSKLQYYYESSRLVKTGNILSAKIVHVENVSGRRSTRRYYPSVEFTTNDGELIRYESPDFSYSEEDFKVGDYVKVYFDPKVRIARIDVFDLLYPDWLHLVLGLPIFLLLTYCSGVFGLYYLSWVLKFIGKKRKGIIANWTTSLTYPSAIVKSSDREERFVIRSRDTLSHGASIDNLKGAVVDVYIPFGVTILAWVDLKSAQLPEMTDLSQLC